MNCGYHVCYVKMSYRDGILLQKKKKIEFLPRRFLVVRMKIYIKTVVEQLFNSMFMIHVSNAKKKLKNLENVEYFL